MLVSDALRRIDLALGEPLGGPMRGALSILNEAGTDFFASNPWRFARSMRGKATLAAGQEYVRLPLGCARLISIERVPLWSGTVQLVDSGTFQRVKATRETFTDLFFFATEDYPLVDGRPTLRLALDHAPTDTVVNAFIVAFEAEWTPVTGEVDGEAMLPLPPYVEPYFAARLEAYALGVERGGLSARLVEVDAGPLRAAAMDRDMRAVVAGGPPVGTALQMARRSTEILIETSTIHLETT